MTEELSIDADPDMQGATAALIRAAKKARELAARTRTEYVVFRDGQLVREIPEMESTFDSSAQNDQSSAGETSD